MAGLAAASTSALLEELKRRVFCADKKEKRSIIFGPPGAGKGTQRYVRVRRIAVLLLRTRPASFLLARGALLPRAARRARARGGAPSPPAVMINSTPTRWLRGHR